MSGGVGPCGDISLPKEQQLHEQEAQATFFKSSQSTPQPRRAGGGLFTFRQLNALAVAIVLSASGMVSAEDFAFVVFSLAYMYFISKVAFPTISPSMEPPIFGENNRVLGLYIFVAAIIGIFLPIAYIFAGIFEGDKQGIKAASPHLFLLVSQVFMEGVAFSDRFSLPIRVFVPVFYNSRRIFSLTEWLKAEVGKIEGEHSGGMRRLYIGRTLAMANMALWSFNLFGFLLPVFLPRAFKKYFSELKEKDQKVK